MVFSELFNIRFAAFLNLFNDQNLTQLPDKLSYALRFPGESRKPPAVAPEWFNWKTDFLFPFFPNSGPRSKNYDDDGYPAGYYNEGRKETTIF